MTDNVVCIKCGWSKPAHSCQDINKKLARPEYDMSLGECIDSGGFDPGKAKPTEDPDAD